MKPLSKIISKLRVDQSNLITLYMYRCRLRETRLSECKSIHFTTVYQTFKLAFHLKAKGIPAERINLMVK